MKELQTESVTTTLKRVEELANIMMDENASAATVEDARIAYLAHVQCLMYLARHVCDDIHEAEEDSDE